MIMPQQLGNQNILNQKLVQVNLERIVHKIQNSDMLNYMKRKSKKVKLETLRHRMSKIEGSLSDEIIRNREDRI